ncbi:unnamed protein product [Trichogramma brassicae]|uniref:Uncharacterized protein n=1 Tax=Trichogramma brassicae TaxID=86971 RepID=A0A6H5IN86_9HYME|nr:unnamed protein product [Trichogramma brassicae]
MGREIVGGTAPMRHFPSTSERAAQAYIYCRAKRLIWARTRYRISKRDVYNTTAAVQRRENARIPVSNHTHAIESSRARVSCREICAVQQQRQRCAFIAYNYSIYKTIYTAREGGRGIEIIDRDLVGEGAPLYVNIYKSDNASVLAGAPHVFRHKIHSTLSTSSGATAVTHIDDARARIKELRATALTFSSSMESRFSSQLERAKERFEIRAAIFVAAVAAAAAKMRRLSLLATLLLHLLYTVSVYTYKRMSTLASRRALLHSSPPCANGQSARSCFLYKRGVRPSKWKSSLGCRPEHIDSRPRIRGDELLRVLT